MPKRRPATSGYARLAQAEEEERSHGVLEESDEEDIYHDSPQLSTSAPRYAPIQPGQHSQMHLSRQTSPTGHRRRPSTGRRRVRSNSSGVDIKAINARLERWAEEIASKFRINKGRGKSREGEQLEIHHSVFQPPDGVRPVTAETLNSESPGSDGRMTKIEFDDIVEGVRVAIEMGVHPKMISQGSSGSYFARNTEGNVVGVFKPKDEEPYASRNPKWTKWIHRNLFPCFFGRACLIPNLSYVSEAAAYVLDSRLRTKLVPYTDIVYLSSKSFFYDYWDRRSFYRRRKPLPAKVGSFQVFLKGFKDANIFLKQYPWPDQVNSGLRPDDAPTYRKKAWTELCKISGDRSDEEEGNGHILSPALAADSSSPNFQWTPNIKQSFREELEKLVILDYIMRNTDRGLDNWMIKVDWHTEEVSIVAEPPKMNSTIVETDDDPGPRPVPVHRSDSRPKSSEHEAYKRQEAMSAASRSGTPSNADAGRTPSIGIGAIDNSLSWPWKHPDATQLALRRVFSQDCDFKESMFLRQIAVMKGQAWNVVETLKQPDHGPLELTRRMRVCVWDDIVDIPVAIPLRTPSAEMHRQKTQAHQEEEMDIGATNSSSPLPQRDLLSMSSPTSDLPNPNRFELSREQSQADLGRLSEAEEATSKLASSNSLPKRPLGGRSRTRVSFESPSRMVPSEHRRHNSFSVRRGSSAFMYDGDDLEGDLGYAAAEGMEGHERKVIVERVEAVKSKNPKRNLKCHYFHAFLQDRSKALQTLTRPRISRFADAEEALAFQYYIEWTNPWFELDNDPCCYSACNPAFFNPFILTLIDSEPAIKHLVLATAAAHRYLMDDPAGLPEELVERVPFFQLHYEAALRHVNDDISCYPRFRLPLILTCCLLFIVCENFTRRAGRSLVHLQGGLRILQEFEAAQRTPSAAGEAAPAASSRQTETQSISPTEILYHSAIQAYIKPLFEFYESKMKLFGRLPVLQFRFSVRKRSFILVQRKKLMGTTGKRVPGLPCMHGYQGPEPVDWEKMVREAK
ncbi:MAG: hypothetical protein Q9227_001519 [Pyrenula ochraceoflavens]